MLSAEHRSEIVARADASREASLRTELRGAAMSGRPEPLPEWYMRQAALRALRGETVTLPPDDEPSNIHSIALARTNRAIAQMMRRGAMSGPTGPAA
jgi:hypothetical protein